MEHMESDLLGERGVPVEAYWGVHTLRALENFQITGVPIGSYPELVIALASVKQAAAEANRDLGMIDSRRAEAIIATCEELRAGRLHHEFVVDAVQGGAGTSTNMNANEVIANRSLELLGHRRGEYHLLHPNNHVNLSQSTNDVYPTAIKLALIAAIKPLIDALGELEGAFAAKARELAGVVKIGRTQLQDAVPMTLGQEMGAFAVMLSEDAARLEEAAALLHEINLGGTGITAPSGYVTRVCANLARITGLDLQTAPDLIEATQDAGVFVQLSGVLKRIAVKLSKTCNDLRLLSSGPQIGLTEIRLPSVQAGSSIMPGKVNPVIPEVVNQVAFVVIGNDTTVTMAAEAGQLQLNAFEPIMFRALYDSIGQLAAGAHTLADRCILGITADHTLLEQRVRESLSVVTALCPHIGYEAATAIALEAFESGRSVPDLVLELRLLSRDQLDYLLSLAALTGCREELATAVNEEA